MNPTEPLIELLFDRLATDDVPTDTAEVVLGALGGDADLTAILAGEPAALHPQPGTEDGPRPRIWLDSVTVTGFRGVGPQRTLRIEPGPGLTLVVGRNGSGKSSFAEATELALTGDSARWADRNSVWRTGWRNLHAPGKCRIEVSLDVDGSAGPIRVRRSWAADADLDAAEVTVTGDHGERTSLAGLGLARPVELYRPFLTAAELGRLSAGTQSQLFDAINSILGLEAVTAADRRLMVAVRPYETAGRQVRAQRTELRITLADIDDDRARRAGIVLADTHSDLDRLDAILDEPMRGGADDTIAACRRLVNLMLPEPDAVTALAGELSAAIVGARLHDGSADQTSRRTAELLQLAVAHHGEQGDGPCPVCDSGRLDADWLTSARDTLTELRERGRAAQQATERLAELTRRAYAVIDSVDVPEVDVPGIPIAALHAAVAALRASPAGAPGDVDALAGHLAAHYPTVVTAAHAAREYAAGWLRQRDSGWQRIAVELRAWVDAARQLPGREATARRIKAARAWLKDVGAQLRDERVAPFAAHSQRIWRQLRQESNIELGTMALAGTNTTRRVVFPVSVDGADNGTALGVMSQGEMHALGLATFLPRGCAQESPFRFVVVDDPVQSMDPSKVAGLARVLAELAEERQVVVFTHDSRLPDAVRRLDLGHSRVIEVTRAERSVVTLRPGGDPVRRYLDDAMALACSDEVPADVRAPVVAELCRSALEAACHQIVWRTRVARGVPHADIEAALGKAAHRLTLTFALALFNDPERGGDVLGLLRRRYGVRAVEAYQACQKGVHGARLTDLPGLVRDVTSLAGALA